MKRLQYILLCGLLLLAVACEKDTLPMNFSPALTTGEASDIYRVGATLSGTIQKSDGVVVQDYGFLISELQSMAEYTEIKITSTESTFDVMVQNLEPGKKYYYCAYANSGYSIARGEIKEFSTLDSNAPIFGELKLESKDERSFTVSTVILDTGGSDLTLCGFCWKLREGDSDLPTVEDNINNVIAQAGTLSARFKDLLPNKDYLVRAYGVNAKGTGYSKVMTVSTNDATVPTLSSIVLIDSTAISLNVKASVLSTGKSEITEIGFCWSTLNEKPTTADKKYNAIEQKEEPFFTHLIYGLLPETVYHIRAYAVNAQGTGYGDTYKFVTGKRTEPGIYTLADLLDFRDKVNERGDLSLYMNDDKVVNLYADIDMGSIENWRPIDYIEGTFNGNGHVIDNLKMTEFKPEWCSYGYGFINHIYGTVENLHIGAGSRITYTLYDYSSVTVPSGISNVGMIGHMSAYSGSPLPKVINCTSAATIKIISDSGTDYLTIGGIVGENWGGIIQGCSYTGTIDCTSKEASIGGICGSNGMGEISDCNNWGTIGEGYECKFLGGIVGSMAARYGAIIQKCINMGQLNGGQAVALGGICGYATELDATIIDQCRNEGEILNGKTDVGGIVGYAEASVTNCQNVGNIISSATSIGGICGTAKYVNAFTGNINEGMVNNTAGEMIGTDLRGPALENITISDITQTSAHVVARILDIGGAPVKEKGFIYYTGSEYGTSIKIPSTVEGNQIVVTLTNLAPGTKYYIYSYAKNGIEDGRYNYGEKISFTTLPQ